MSQNVSLRHIDLTLSGNKILDDVSLDIESGSFVTLLGPSGSGKSTTLNVIAGFLRANSGQVLFDGADVQNLAPGARKLGIVFQNYAIFPHMTIGENIMFPLRSQNWKGNRKARVADMLDLVKLNGFENRRASTLSGGQLQRVALARALAPAPQVLLLDEPLSALDKQLKEAMQGELKSIQREVGVTTISVTHDQAEALAMSDQVVVMNQGRVEQTGDPHTLYSAPANEFLARFLGEVNLIPIDSDGHARPVIPAKLDVKSGFAMTRPEDFLLREVHDATSASFNGRVAQVQFQGSSCRVEVAVEGLTSTLVVRVPYEGFLNLPARGDVIHLEYKKPNVHSVAASDVLPDGTSASTTTIGAVAV